VSTCQLIETNQACGMETEKDQSDQQPLVSWQVGVGLRLFWGMNQKRKDCFFPVTVQ
jgi:hypothetical protein